MTYPDISDILAKKAKARQASAALSFDEKLAVLEALKRASGEISFADVSAPEKHIDQDGARRRGKI